MAQRVGGLIAIKVDSDLYRAKGAFTYNLGDPVREGVVGHDVVHGYKELPQIPFVEGEVTDSPDIDLRALHTISSATITLELANGKTIVLRDAWFAGEGGGNTEEGALTVRFEGMSADEV